MKYKQSTRRVMALQRRKADVETHEKRLKSATKEAQTLEGKTYREDEYKKLVARKLATAQAEVEILTERTKENTHASDR